MAGRQEITTYVSRTLSGFLEENGLSLYHADFAKQGKSRNLTVYIDRIQNDPDGETLYVSSDDCERVSRYLSDCLDRDDPISGNYVLIVSSPGLDRELYEPEHFRRFLGSRTDIRLYGSQDGKREFSGELLSYSDEDLITIREDDGTERSFDRKAVAKASLAVIF